MQIQISWLLQKPTDLDLHCLQRKGISGISRTRVKYDSDILIMSLNITFGVRDFIYQCFHIYYKKKERKKKGTIPERLRALSIRSVFLRYYVKVNKPFPNTPCLAWEKRGERGVWSGSTLFVTHPDVFRHVDGYSNEPVIFSWKCMVRSWDVQILMVNSLVSVDMCKKWPGFSQLAVLMYPFYLTRL